MGNLNEILAKLTMEDISLLVLELSQDNFDFLNLLALKWGTENQINNIEFALNGGSIKELPISSEMIKYLTKIMRENLGTDLMPLEIAFLIDIYTKKYLDKEKMTKSDLRVIESIKAYNNMALFLQNYYGHSFSTTMLYQDQNNKWAHIYNYLARIREIINSNLASGKELIYPLKKDERGGVILSADNERFIDVLGMYATLDELEHHDFETPIERITTTNRRLIYSRKA